MKKLIIIIYSGLILLSLISCSNNIRKTDDSTRTVIATVVNQKSVLVGEYDEGSKIVEENFDNRIITWEGFDLSLKAEDGNIYRYLSKDLYFEGDRVLVKIQDGKILSVKFSP
jgi:hypothetical protein